MLACLLALAALAAAPTEGDPSLVRIVSYNIHHAEGNDGRLDLDRVAGVIAALRPDVLCLQEVDRGLPRTQGMDMPARFAEKLGMHVVFEPNYRFDGGEYGNAVLSRWPVVSHRNHALPGPEGVEPRGCLEVVLAHPEHGPFPVLCTHLGLRAAEREAQAKHIAGLLAEKPRLILAGDMNETVEGAGLRIFLAHLRDSLAGDPPAPPSFPSHAPARRIDYILAGPAWRVVEASVVKTAESAVASDHLPCLAVLAPAE